MAQRFEKTQTLSFADLQAHPERITDMLSAHESIPLLLEKRGDLVCLGTAPKYSAETDRLLEEALSEYSDMKRQGYRREDAFKELEALQQELGKRAEE